VVPDLPQGDDHDVIGPQGNKFPAQAIEKMELIDMVTHRQFRACVCFGHFPVVEGDFLFPLNLDQIIGVILPSVPNSARP
jgi:hypothetical protein